MMMSSAEYLALNSRLNSFAQTSKGLEKRNLYPVQSLLFFLITGKEWL